MISRGLVQGFVVSSIFICSWIIQVNHSKKGIQYKTDQNFYFLWAILFKTSVGELQNNRQEEFERVSRIFSVIQKAPADYTTEKFLNELQ